MAKKNVLLSLPEEIVETVDRFAEERELTRSAAVEQIIMEFERKTESQIDLVARRFLEIFDEKYNAVFTRLRLGTRTADINSQITLELLNTLMIQFCEDVDLVPTKKYRAIAFMQAEAEIKKRIAAYKQNKDWKNQKEND